MDPMRDTSVGRFDSGQFQKHAEFLVAPTLKADQLHQISQEEALALVESRLGRATDWSSALIHYRMSSEFQSDWREELGHWLHAAQVYGYLDPLLTRLNRAKQKTGVAQIEPNDPYHRILWQEAAQAMFAYYFLRTGWKFVAWEPKATPPADIDLLLETPDGIQANFQVKASDQPGHVANYHRVNGENDGRVLEGLSKAASQLPQTSSAINIVGINAIRDFPLALDPGFVLSAAIGATTQIGDDVILYAKDFGLFSRDWKHVSAIVILDFARFTDYQSYPCRVLLNPWAPVVAKAAWFPHAHVCWSDGTAFRWTPKEPPNNLTTFPQDVRIVA